jgi:F420-dependent oxidoreductase-like protein
VEIGLYIGDVTGPCSLAEARTSARQAQQHHFAGVWAAQALGWDSLVLLGLVGDAVADLKVGSAVVPIAQRHPLVLASQALSVQAAVGGRLTLGLGTGIGAMVEGMFGLPTDRPARRMREYLTALIPLLRQEPVDFHGETLTTVGQVQIKEATAPQVLVAALGPAMLRVAGELADGVVTWMTGPRTIDSHIMPALDRAQREANRRSPRVVAGTIVCVTDNEQDARERVGAYYQMAGQVPEYRSVLDREGVIGPADIAAIGTETAVADQLRRLADAGVTELAVAPFGTDEERARTIAFLAELKPPAPEPAPTTTPSSKLQPAGESTTEYRSQPQTQPMSR